MQDSVSVIPCKTPRPTAIETDFTGELIFAAPFWMKRDEELTND